MAKKWLKIVYTEKNPAKLKLHYKSWAKEYDKDLTDWGYAYPKRLKEIILSKKIKISKKANILDAGCGTGLVGLQLKRFGYGNFHGADLSQKLLDTVPKNLYQKLSMKV